MITKKETIERFNLSINQVNLIDNYLDELFLKNKTTNLVGKSTLINVWDRHVCDSLQIISHIKNVDDKIIDMGTGAGIPGIFLSIMGYKNVLMIDSVNKKTDFVKNTIDKLGILAAVSNSRLENVKTSPAKYIVSRALAPLHKLISYSLLFSNKDTSLLFLKGRNVNKEIEEANKKYSFKFKAFKSKSFGAGFVLKIYDFKKK